MSANPYASGRTSAAAADPTLPLYDAQSVALATFLGSPAAGGVVLAINNARLGRIPQAVACVAAGLAATLGLMGIYFILPISVPLPISTLFNLGIAFGMKHIARELHGNDLVAHLNAGRRIASRWGAAGIGVLTSFLLVAVVAAILLTIA